MIVCVSRSVVSNYLLFFCEALGACEAGAALRLLKGHTLASSTPSPVAPKRKKKKKNTASLRRHLPGRALPECGGY